MLRLPRLYAIIDASSFRHPSLLVNAAEELVSGGATLVQYRNKHGSPDEILECASQLKRRIGKAAKLIMNDRADLCLAAGFDGIHVGQDDLLPGTVREIIGFDLLLGVSTHNPSQVVEADSTSADYVAIGPIFTTANKANPDPVIGLEGVRLARGLTQKPLVAIGGITRENCRQVIEAGADSVAVIGDLVRDPGKSAEEFFRILR